MSNLADTQSPTTPKNGFGSATDLIRPGPLREMALDRAVVTCLRLTDPHNRRKWSHFLDAYITPTPSECHRIIKKFWWHHDHPWGFLPRSEDEPA